MKITTKFVLVAVILLSAMAISPKVTTGQSSADYVVVYGMPYDFEEYWIYTANSYAAQQWLSAVGGGLFARSAADDRAVVEDLAESYTVSSDKLTFTVTMKKGLKFSDGSKLTADDVVATYKMALNPSINTVSYATLAAYMNNDSITAIDDQTVSFKLTDKYAFAVNLFTQPIQPAELFADRIAAEDWTGLGKSDLSDALSAGPFKVESFDATNNEIVMVRNKYFWNADNVVSDKIVFKQIAEKAAAVSALTDGSIDIFDSQYVAGKTELKDIAGITEEIIAAPVHQEMFFNHKHPIFGTGEDLPASVTDKTEGAKAVRKAMSHLIDRDFAANDILEGLGLPAATIIPSAAVGWDSTIKPREYSVTKAKEYMVAAGFDYADIGSPNSEGNYEQFFFNVTVTSPNTNPARNTWSALLASQLGKIGIGLNKHESLEWADFADKTFNAPGPVGPFDKTDNSGFDIGFVGYGWDLDVDPFGLYESTSLLPAGGNFYNFENAEYDKLIPTYTTELDLEKRLAAFKEVQKFYFEWEIVAPIVYPADHWAYADDLVGYDSVLLSGSSAEWDLIGSQEAKDAVGTGFLPIDVTALLGAFVVLGVVLRKKRKN